MFVTLKIAYNEGETQVEFELCELCYKISNHSFEVFHVVVWR